MLTLEHLHDFIMILLEYNNIMISLEYNIRELLNYFFTKLTLPYYYNLSKLQTIALAICSVGTSAKHKNNTTEVCTR